VSLQFTQPLDNLITYRQKLLQTETKESQTAMTYPETRYG